MKPEDKTYSNEPKVAAARTAPRSDVILKILKYCGWYLVGFWITSSAAAALYAVTGCVMVACNFWEWSTVLYGSLGTGIGTGLVNGFVVAHHFTAISTKTSA